jgi:hypothetical protein
MMCVVQKVTYASEAPMLCIEQEMIDYMMASKSNTLTVTIQASSEDDDDESIVNKKVCDL